MTEKKIKIDKVLKEVKEVSSKRGTDISKKLNSIKGISENLNYRFDEVLYYYAVAGYQNERLNKALYYIEKCIELQKNDKNKKDDRKIAETYSFYGNILDYIGDYESALEVLNKAISIQRKLSNKTPLAYSYMRIGNINRKFLKENDKSLLYYNKALKLSKKLKNDFLTASALGCIANAYLYKHEYSNADKNYQKAAELFEKIENKFYLCTALLGIGTTKRELDDNDGSVKALKKALEIIKNSGNKGLNTSVSLNLAISFLNAGDDISAESYYKKSMSLIKKVNDKTLASKLFQGFAEVYENRGDMKKALEHYKKYHDLYAEIFKEESARINKILKLKYEKERSEKEAEIYKLRSKELQHEIDSKTKELNAMASYLSQKNEFVSNLVSNIKEDLLGFRLDEKIGDYINTAVKKAESAGSQNEDLKRFESELDKFSFSFISSLLKKFPTLTRVELKICSMIKINLSTKEMANLLYLSPRTVESHKYNINKKIKLKSKQNVVTFLNSV